MRPDPALTLYINWLMNIGFLVSFLFVPVNSLWWPWWREWWGWNIILLDAFIAGDLFPSVLYIDFHVTTQLLQWSEALSLTATVLVIPWRAVMIYATQRHVAREILRERERHDRADCADSG